MSRQGSRTNDRRWSRSFGLADVFQRFVEVGCRVTDLLFGWTKNTHVRDGLNAKLPHDRRAPIDDVNLEQNDVRVVFGQLFEVRTKLLTGNAPVRVKIHYRDL